jgi:hypothetical protein
MNFKILFATLALVMVQATGFSQEVLLSDSGFIPPFEGVIGYRIKYEGKVNPASKPYLPDSMTLFVGKNGLLYRYHGGKIDGLQSEMLWDGDAQAFWLMDPRHKTAETMSDIWMGYVAKPAKTTEKVKVAGRPCVAWTLTREKPLGKPGEKIVEKAWVNDSIYFGGDLVDTLKVQQPAFLAAGIRAIPLQARRPHAEEVVTVMTAVTISPGPQDKWLFKVPEGYRLGEFDPSEVLHPILKPEE